MFIRLSQQTIKEFSAPPSRGAVFVHFQPNIKLSCMACHSAPLPFYYAAKKFHLRSSTHSPIIHGKKTTNEPSNGVCRNLIPFFFPILYLFLSFALCLGNAKRTDPSCPATKPSGQKEKRISYKIPLTCIVEHS